MSASCQSKFVCQTPINQTVSFYLLLIKDITENEKIVKHVLLHWRLSLILHSGIISRDINLFKTHFYSYISVIPGVILQYMVLLEVLDKLLTTNNMLPCQSVVLCFSLLPIIGLSLNATSLTLGLSGCHKHLVGRNQRKHVKWFSIHCMYLWLRSDIFL